MTEKTMKIIFVSWFAFFFALGVLIIWNEEKMNRLFPQCQKIAENYGSGHTVLGMNMPMEGYLFECEDKFITYDRDTRKAFEYKK